MAYFLDCATIGSGQHRSGWPYALRALKRAAARCPPLLIDDYIERTFLSEEYQDKEIVHTVPWIGFVHHPPDMPEWYDRWNIKHLPQSERWRISLPFLRLVVTFDDNARKWIEDNWGKPAVALRHPTAVPRTQWSPRLFRQNRQKRLIQIGWFLRNTHGIYQVNVTPTFRKTRFVQDIPEMAIAHHKCAIALPKREYVGEVEELHGVTNEEFDAFLSQNLVFVELIAAVANNTVVECIARNTPIILNRLPGPEHYLGSQYPLFFNSVEEVQSLISDSSILSAYHHLQRLDKSWLRADAFANQFVHACEENRDILTALSH